MAEIDNAFAARLDAISAADVLPSDPWLDALLDEANDALDALCDAILEQPVHSMNDLAVLARIAEHWRLQGVTEAPSFTAPMVV